jgi:hypothetical protein
VASLIFRPDHIEFTQPPLFNPFPGSPGSRGKAMVQVDAVAQILFSGLGDVI